MKNPPHPLPVRSNGRGAVSGALIAVALVVGVLIVLAISAFGSYNGLQARRTTVEQKIAALDSQYKRRAELIPNLVETVKGSAEFEQTTLQNVVEARANATKFAAPPSVDDPAELEAWLKAQSTIGGALSRLLVVAENYPQLRATEQFGQLQAQLEGTENRIAVARSDWTESVRDYNTKLRTFPGNLVGGIFGLKELPQFAAAEEERSVPKVDFGSQK